MNIGDLVQIKRPVIQQNPHCAYHGIGVVVDTAGQFCSKVLWLGLSKEARQTRTFPKRYLEIVSKSHKKD